MRVDQSRRGAVRRVAGRLRLLSPAQLCANSGTRRRFMCMTTWDRSPRHTWRKSSRSIGDGACVELAADVDSVMVRDSGDRGGPLLRYSIRAWRVFLIAARNGEFNESP